jgi:hypothetical protein
MRLMLSKFFWEAPISWKTKFCYITGFMFYAHHPLIIVFSFHLFWTLFLYNEYIPSGQSLSFYPHILFATLYLWWLPIAKLRLGYFGLLTARMYAYGHAVKSAFLRKSVGWVSTNAKHNVVSEAFRQTTTVVTVYVALYCLLVLLGIWTGDIHLADYKYWSIQFWLFWNLLLSSVLLYRMLSTRNRMTGTYARFGYEPIGHVSLLVATVAILTANSVAQLLTAPVVTAEPIQVQPVVDTPTVTTEPQEVEGMIASPSATPKRRPRPTPTKEPGGWYWQKELGRAQRWIGTDAEGKDIWSD